MDYTNNSKVLNCIIRNNEGTSVYIISSSNVQIKGCEITKNGGYFCGGISTFRDTCLEYKMDNIEISGCTISENYPLGIGVDPTGCSNIMIHHNRISEHEWFGIVVEGNGSTSTNVDISNNTIVNNGYGELYNGVFFGGVFLQDCNGGITLKDNEIMNNSGDYGVSLYNSSDNHIIKNNIGNNQNGIRLLGDSAIINKKLKIYYARDNLIMLNNFTNNVKGINASLFFRLPNCTVLAPSINNKIFYNNFRDNAINAFDGCLNMWYNPISKKGNYWDDYTGLDNNGDGIGDTPYNVPPYPFHNKDRYPLMEPINTGNTKYSYNEISQITSKQQTLTITLSEQEISQVIAGNQLISQMFNTVHQISNN